MAEAAKPEDIECHEQVFDISFHPKAHVLAIAMIDGTVDIWKYGVGEGANQRVLSSKLHEGSCRGAKFNADGDRLFTISSDRTLQAVDGHGAKVTVYENAHANPINKLQHVNDNILATGDDAGVVKLWDVRTANGEVMSWTLHEDFVSGFCYHEESNTLFSVGGDATLCIYDLKNEKSTFRSDDQESELHCVEVLKGGRKVSCGTQDGVILMFSWGKWGDCSDRYPGHPQTVDCMYKIDESTVCTGSSDGLIRVVALQPNKILGVIGDHDEFPVEGITCNKDKALLGSFSHDEIVRFWDVSIFAEDDGDEFDNYDEEEEQEEQVRDSATAAIEIESGAWADMSDDSGEMLEDNSSLAHSSNSTDSEDEIIVHRKKIPTKAEKFYSDL